MSPNFWGCRCCGGVAFHLFAGADASTLSDNDRFESSSRSWSSKTNVPSPARSSNTAFTISGIAYTVCGGSTSSTLRDNDSYQLDTWTAKTDCTSASSDIISGTVGDNAYVVIYTGPNYEYAAAGDSWSTKTSASSPSQQGYAAEFSLDSGVFRVTGTSSTGSNDIQKYTPSGDSWTSKTDFPRAKHQAAGMSIGTNGYLSAGYAANSSFPHTELTLHDEYAPSGDSWTSLSENAYGAADSSAVGFSANGYVCGGAITATTSPFATTYYSKNERYTPGSDSWLTDTVFPDPKRFLMGGTSL